MAKQDTQKTLVGKLLINNIDQDQASEVEISPAGNNVYAITIRMPLTERLKSDPQMLTTAPQEIVYRHPLMGMSRYFKANLVDSGLIDANGKCTIILFYRAQSVPSPVSVISDVKKPLIY